MSSRDEEKALIRELYALMDRARPIVEKLTAARPVAEKLTGRAALDGAVTEEAPDEP